MSSSLDLHGVYVPLITPFDAAEKPAFGELERLANEAIEAGAAGLVVLGTTGEPATLDKKEQAAAIEIVAEACRNNPAQLIIGAGTNSTRTSIEAVHEANNVDGVTALLSVVPYYTRPSEAGIVAHFKTLAAESDVPLIVYNIPYRTGRGLGSASLLELAGTPNIAGLKQAVGGIDIDTMRLMSDKPADFHVLCGDDPYVYPMMALGGAGAIAASAHLRTADFVALVDAALKGDILQAREMSNALLPLCETLFAEPSPGILKGVLAAQGRISAPVLRAPMTQASKKAITEALQYAS